MSKEESVLDVASIGRVSSLPEESPPHPSTEISAPNTAVVTEDTCTITPCVVSQQSHSTNDTSDETVKSKATPSSATSQQELKVEVGDVIPEGMSKNQWKKMKRLQKREEANRRKKQQEKEKRRLRALTMATKEDGGEMKTKKRELSTTESKGSESTEPKKKKIKLMSDEGASSVKVAIDFGFEDLMTDKDIKMLMKQCQRCYAQNRRADAPLQFYWTSFSGRCKKRMDDVIPSYKGWDIHVRSANYIDEFGKDNVVFLTSDSANILEDLDSSKCYVIGGLVDHNHYKGYCYRKAEELGIHHAQLPISKFIEMNSRKVLAVNHVFEILLSFSANRDWKKAFYDVIPERKLMISAEPTNSESTPPGEQVQQSVTVTVGDVS